MSTVDDEDRTSRQAELLDELERIFLAEGFRRLTLDDLTPRLRCSRSTLYAIAPTKDELVLVVLDRFYRKTASALLQAASEADTPTDRIKGFLEASAAAYEPVSRKFLDDVNGYRPARDIQASNTARAVSHLQGLIEAAIDERGFGGVDASFAAEIGSLAVTAIADGSLLDRTDLTSAEAVRELGLLLLHGVTFGEDGPNRGRRRSAGSKKRESPS